MSACTINGCEKPHYGKGWCAAHYQRWWTYGDPLEPLKIARKGEAYRIAEHGYRLLANRKYEHIAIAEKALGKPLPPGAEVHHLNEIKSDNRPENLVVCPSRSYHALLHKRARMLEKLAP